MCRRLSYSILTTILHSDNRCAADGVTAAVVQGIRFGIRHLGETGTTLYVTHSVGRVKAHDDGCSKACRRQDECKNNFKVYEETKNCLRVISRQSIMNLWCNVFKV